MAFESKRLRVQLPCSKAGTVVEKEPHPAPAPGPAEGARCAFPTPACQGFRSPACVGVRSAAVCEFPTPACYEFATHNCGIASPLCHDLATQVPFCHRFVSVCDRFGTPINCAPGTVVCRAGGTDPGVEITGNCGAASPVEGTVEIPVEPFPEEPDTVLVHPNHLPQLRRQLEIEIEQISALEERKTEVEGQLKDLDVAEKELKKQAKRK